MHPMRVILAMAASYFLFAILLNSVGSVILQSINSFAVTKVQASALEGFKDLSIAAVSFLFASFIPRIGYRIAMVAALSLVTVACLLVPSMAAFWAFKALFALVGASFALVKVSVYALIGQVTNNTQQHSSLMNAIEGTFMLGVLTGYWLFSSFIDSRNPASLEWLNLYYWLAGAGALVALLVVTAGIPASHHQARLGSIRHEFVAMLRLAYQPLVLIFILSIFLYVLIEQGLGTWLPTFNQQVIGLPTQVSIQVTSLFAICLAVGRLGAGVLLRHVHWLALLLVCLAAMAVLVVVSVPLAQVVAPGSVQHVWEAPLAAFLLPCMGLLMAPVYPVLSSVMLSALPSIQHAAMTGLIVVFSALGGTTGSIITGVVFEHAGGQRAFQLLLVPIAMMAATLLLFHRWHAQRLAQESAHAG